MVSVCLFVFLKCTYKRSKCNKGPFCDSIKIYACFQLEKSLKAQIDAWEQEHGKDFLVNGQKFLEYVQQQWDQHHNEKEKEKLERVCEVIAVTHSVVTFTSL